MKRENRNFLEALVVCAVFLAFWLAFVFLTAGVVRFVWKGGD